MEQVFTSYSRRDLELVDAIVAKLAEAGLRVWIDREAIQAGNTWRVQIVEAIDNCYAFVLMFSPNSAASDNVRREIDLTFESERAIFLVMLEPVKVPATMRYQLAGLQSINVQKLGFDKAVGQLIEALKEHIAKFEPAVPPATRQVEMVIQGVDLSSFSPEKQQQLLDFISQLTNADRSQVQLAKLAAGSVHAFVDMPSRAAYELKTAALNRDPRFKELGIVSLRLTGDKKFVSIPHGKLTLAATVSPLLALWWKVPALFSSVLGATGGKIVTLALGAALVAGAGTAASKALAPVPAPSPTATPTTALTATLEPSPASSSTEIPTGTSTSTQTATATLTPTDTLTPTSSPSPVPTYLTLRGVPLRTIACNYGPGDIYLYQEAMNPRYQMDVFGKAQIYYRGREQTWLYTQADGFQRKCFVNAADVQLKGGGLQDLKTVYPGEVKLPPSSLWPAPQNVKAERQGDQVTITWDFYDLPGGERERTDENKPRYLLELWLCRDGELQFTPTGSWDLTTPRSTLRVQDEAGCSEPSHGVIYLAEKHGYEGPVKIPWPAYPVPTATP